QDDGLVAVRGLTGDNQVVLRLDHHPQAGAHESVLVDDEHANGHRAATAEYVGQAGALISSCGLSGRTALTLNPPPSTGPAVSRPPRTLARSVMPAIPRPPPTEPGAGGTRPSSMT